MPIQTIIKNKIKYYRWGLHGKLYRERAKAEAQGRTAYANGHREKQQK